MATNRLSEVFLCRHPGLGELDCLLHLSSRHRTDWVGFRVLFFFLVVRWGRGYLRPRDLRPFDAGSFVEEKLVEFGQLLLAVDGQLVLPEQL